MKIDFGALVDGINEVDVRLQEAIRLYGETEALRLENEAKDKAPWIDRSGRARQSITGRYTSNPNRITLSIGVDYGIFLELAHEKNFAIIWPTIMAHQKEVMRGLSYILERAR